MKEKYNMKSICTGLVVTLIGVLLIPVDLFLCKTPQNLWISIGCSLIASGLVILLTALVVERVKYNPIDEWKITRIYATRAEKNTDSDPELDKARYCVDAVAFGLKSFRSKQTKRVEGCLRRGVNIRILTMAPDSPWVKQREIEEKETEGQIQHTINDLVKWADDLNAQNTKGKIVVKGYNTMTLDFYWRVDNKLFVGPYWYGISSQQTITYSYAEGGKGFQVYSDYFDQLWNDDELCKPLTSITEIRATKRKPR